MKLDYTHFPLMLFLLFPLSAFLLSSISIGEELRNSYKLYTLNFSLSPEVETAHYQSLLSSRQGKELSEILKEIFK